MDILQVKVNIKVTWLSLHTRDLWPVSGYALDLDLWKLIFDHTRLFEDIAISAKCLPPPPLRDDVYYYEPGTTRGHGHMTQMTLTFDIAVWPIFSHKSLNIASSKSYKQK